MLTGGRGAMNESTIDLHVSADEALVSLIRKFAFEYFSRATSDEPLVSQLAMVAHELLDNAIRHCDGAGATLRIASTRENPAEGFVSTSNVASSEKRAAVRRKIDEMRQSSNRSSYYHAAITEALAAGGPGGLGLARIHGETEMTLDVLDSNDGTLTISATTQGWRRS